MTSHGGPVTRPIQVTGEGEVARVESHGPGAGFAIAVKCKRPISEMQHQLPELRGRLGLRQVASSGRARGSRLRSFDRSMPEEINRVVTDQLSQLLFTPSADGYMNPHREGIAPEKIHLVGNVMIDTLIRLLPVARQARKNGRPRQYALVTLHRPANVDDCEMLKKILSSILTLSKDLPVIFPVHPRTHKLIHQFELETNGLQITDPMAYLEFLALQCQATVVITDSGGIQEETTYLGIPCLTVRPNTERPVTVEIGTNILIGNDMEKLRTEVLNVLHGHPQAGQRASAVGWTCQ
jgi:UDP-N-acetylglucosamine 2-epimerase (non-hydrolysing)